MIWNRSHKVDVEAFNLYCLHDLSNIIWNRSHKVAVEAFNLYSMNEQTIQNLSGFN